MRMHEIDATRTIDINGQTAILVPAEARTGSFSRPIGKAVATPAEALVSLSRPHSGDILIRKLSDGRYQAWGRTANARGAQHGADYEFTLAGRRARKHSLGAGQLYMAE